jgi:hypothetical protein
MPTDISWIYTFKPEISCIDVTKCFDIVPPWKHHPLSRMIIDGGFNIPLFFITYFLWLPFHHFDSLASPIQFHQGDVVYIMFCLTFLAYIITIIIPAILLISVLVTIRNLLRVFFILFR